jgi:hypothetical protein
MRRGFLCIEDITLLTQYLESTYQGQVCVVGSIKMLDGGDSPVQQCMDKFVWCSGTSWVNWISVKWVLTGVLQKGVNNSVVLCWHDGKLRQQEQLLEIYE